MGWVLDDLLGLSEYTYERTRARLDGLTDAELLWEPAAWCWSVRSAGAGVGVVPDGTAFPQSVLPFANLAWRLDHLIHVYGASRNAEWVGLPALEPMPPPSLSADEQVRRLELAHARWRSVLTRLDDDALATTIGPIGGQYATSSRASFVHHQLDEAIHHGAELGVMRDLYRAQTTTPPTLDSVVAAAQHGRWDRVVELAESGADVNGGDISALHLAVAARLPEVVRLLLDHGADRTAKDTQYGADALGWAQFFHVDEVIDLLS